MSQHIDPTPKQTDLNALNSKIPTVVNNLTSTSTTSALSAAQGKALHDKDIAFVTLGSGSSGTITLSESMTNFVWLYIIGSGYSNYLPIVIPVSAWPTNTSLWNSNSLESNNYSYSVKRTANNKVEIGGKGGSIQSIIVYGVMRR